MLFILRVGMSSHATILSSDFTFEKGHPVDYKDSPLYAHRSRRWNGVSEIQLTVFFLFLPSHPILIQQEKAIISGKLMSKVVIGMRNREATLNEYDNFRIILTVGYNCAAFEIGGRFLFDYDDGTIIVSN